MQKFIIGYGRKSNVDMIDAVDLEAARMEAARRTMLDGVLDDDLPDYAWAEPYTSLAARDYGLTADRRTRGPWWS